MKTINLLNLTVDNLKEFFGGGKFATVTFIKKDGTKRTLNGKTKVNQQINGNGPSYDAESHGQIRIFDMVAKGWRTVTASQVKEVRTGGVRYVIG